jgi:hypothetical protein
MKMVTMILALIIFAACTETTPRNNVLRESIVDARDDAGATPTQEAVESCLDDCAATESEACASCDLFTCTGERVDCRADCGEACTVRVFDTMYWCIADALSLDVRDDCVRNYLAVIDDCDWVDDTAAAYAEWFEGWELGVE